MKTPLKANYDDLFFNEEAVQEVIEDLIFDVDGMEINSIKVTHDKRTPN